MYRNSIHSKADRVLTCSSHITLDPSTSLNIQWMKSDLSSLCSCWLNRALLPLVVAFNLWTLNGSPVCNTEFIVLGKSYSSSIAYLRLANPLTLNHHYGNDWENRTKEGKRTQGSGLPRHSFLSLLPKGHPAQSL